ncbi:MAG: 30S ribosomal protein S16 [Planctomycetota bacterium]
MVVKLRLKRFGRLNHPTYRLCAADSRWPRDGRVIETLGYYLPKEKKEAEQVKLNAERVSYWISVGAQPSETARSLMRRAGIELPTKARKKPTKKRKAKAKPFSPPRRKGKKAKGGAAAPPAEGAS